MHTLRDSLRQLTKGQSIVAEFGRKFKLICEQLAAIGHAVKEHDKHHWFLCGLGAAFETFSTSQRAIVPRSSFRDLLAQAESHEMFLQSIHASNPPQAAFVAREFRNNHGSNSRSGCDSNNRGQSRQSANRGRSNGN
ncbi:hypothetical protein HanIR_Chr06g0256381 [Helianthus annuus]|nr:hypothetical protein HanIR_Chr06g0256381 [Helianthus annuus]